MALVPSVGVRVEQSGSMAGAALKRAEPCDFAHFESRLSAWPRRSWWRPPALPWSVSFDVQSRWKMMRHKESPKSDKEQRDKSGEREEERQGEVGDFDEDYHGLPELVNLIIKRYDGDTEEEQFHGKGVARFEGGHIYKGTFSLGLMDGRGVFTWADGLKYEGDFVNNVLLGHGRYTWPDGSFYEGKVYNGIRHGSGTYQNGRSGASYKGQWNQGKRHGKGAAFYNQEKTSWYKGDWVMNKKEGWGVRCYPSGNIYFGEWKNNLRHGEGTMRWLTLQQQYIGGWQDGAQHGHGTYMWIQRLIEESPYCQNNRYIGEFVGGLRHGQGTFQYANGAIYEGEWRNNKKHGKGKFTAKVGQIFEGEFVEDRMVLPKCSGNEGSAPNVKSSFALQPAMTVNIECLLDKIPAAKCGEERKQVEIVVLRHSGALRSVYSFYSRLGNGDSSSNSLVMSRIQLWRLLKDCHIHHHGISLTQLNRFTQWDTPASEVHSPFTPMQLRRVLSCLIITAYHIYHKDMASEEYLLAACFSKLLSDDFLPNAKNVQGFLFRQPERTLLAINYLIECWEKYQLYCTLNGAPQDDCVMTYRQLLWMFKDLNLFDDKLTVSQLVKLVATESPDPSNLTACLNEQVSFLEFFEVLLGCAEVKCHVAERTSEAPSPKQVGKKSPRTPNISPEVKDGTASTHGSPVVSSPKSKEAAASTRRSPIGSSPKSKEAVGSSLRSPIGSSPKSKDSYRSPIGSSPKSAGRSSKSSPSVPEVATRQDQGTPVSSQSAGESKDGEELELEIWTQAMDRFFNHFFFPAFEHYQLVSSYIDKSRKPPNQVLLSAKKPCLS